MSKPSSIAILWCEAAYRTANGKTAHGLVRFTQRYQVAAVVDSTCASQDAGTLLDGAHRGIPVCATLAEAIAHAATSAPATHLVIGLAPDGGRLPESGRKAVREALSAGLSVHSGLHDFLSEDPELAALAAQHGVALIDVRKPPPRAQLHAFTGRIDEVRSHIIAVLGTDSTVGKRTTAWKLVQALQAEGRSAVLIGTGQTAWLQGAHYSLVLDSLVNDFVAGELEHAVLSAWDDLRPDVIVVEGQGALMHPAYPGGFEILAATRPAVILLQHAPTREVYDGFPGSPMHPLDTQLRAIALISGRPVVAITVNHEGLNPTEARAACARIASETGLPVCDPLLDGLGPVLQALLPQQP